MVGVARISSRILNSLRCSRTFLRENKNICARRHVCATQTEFLSLWPKLLIAKLTCIAAFVYVQPSDILETKMVDLCV